MVQTIKCSCYAEELHIEKIDPDITEISFWTYAGNGLSYRSLWTRIKHSLSILFKGYYKVDWVILSDKGVKEMSDKLMISLREMGV